MNLELADYQIDAIDRLQPGNILCGGVGSGKSRTALAYYFLNVCQGRLCINGHGSYKKPKINKPLYIITTARKRDTKEWLDECIPFKLTTVVVDSWNNAHKYVDVKDAFFIFDEQRVVGSGAWVKAFLKITKNNLWILLSATPGDTWMDYIPVFQANKFYKTRREFLERHVVFSRYTRYPKVERYLEITHLLKLRKSIMVNMKFERKTIAHSKILKSSYNTGALERIYKDRWNVFTDMPIRDVSEMCFASRRLVNTSVARIQQLEKLLLKHSKAIIFYNFDYELEILLEVGKRLKRKTSQLNGHKHEPVPITKEWIYLVQYMAGAEAWNCITTDTIIFYSQNYSYRIMTQAAGRIDRANTPFVDLYFYYLSSNSFIDKAIEAALDKKQNFNESSLVL